MAILTIDGQKIDVPDGTNLFEACRSARGEALPHFCYHPDLKIAGVCRLCQVEVEGMPKLTIACNTTVRDDMVVHTRSDKVKKAVKQVLEMHLINHPVDCPICDQAGECGLQDQYMDFGLYDSKIEMADKVNKPKAQVIGPHVVLDVERCVLCTRCVRFCADVTKTNELGIFNRGDRAEIGVAPGVELNNNYSLNTVDLCPVGALTSRDFRFQMRVWMLKAAEGICSGCATGCNIRIDHAGDRIYRLKPRYNPDVNQNWMCDRGRMTYKAVHDERRLKDPLQKRDGQQVEVRWADIQQEIEGLLKPGGVGLVIGSAFQSLEEMFLLRTLAFKVTGQDQFFGGVAGSDMKTGDDILLSADRTPNRQGLKLLQINEIEPGKLADCIAETRGSIVIFGGNPAENELVSAALQNADRVLYLGTHHNETAKLASLVLPVAAWAEQAGIFVNRDGRLQKFQNAVARPGVARDGWQLLVDILVNLGVGNVPESLADVRRLMSEDVSGLVDLDLNKLPERGLLLADTAAESAPETGGEG